MLLAAALLIAALAAPPDVGVAAPSVAGAAVADAGVRQLAEGTAPRPSRARAPVAPPLRRLVRKRGIGSLELPSGGAEADDASVRDLARALDRSAAALLGRARARPGRSHIRLPLVLAGLVSHAFRTPPPTLHG